MSPNRTATTRIAASPKPATTPAPTATSVYAAAAGIQHRKETIMAQQQQHQQTSQQQQDEEEVADVQPAKPDTELVEHADALLDEIDDVLEANAEQFVQAFHQKGGE